MKHPPFAVLATLAVAIFGTTLAWAQASPTEATLRSATELAKKLEQTTAAKKPVVKLPTGDPCTMLTLAEVRQAFPNAQAGVRSPRLERYGATECAWKGAEGRVVLAVQERHAAGTAQQDVEGMAAGLTDPTKPAVAGSVRYEVFAGLGSQAVAFVEAADAKRGILSDWALLSIRRDTHALWLMSGELPLRDRAAALKTLQALGRSAAKRLD